MISRFVAIGLAFVCGLGAEPLSPLSALRIPISGYALDTRIHAVRPIQGLPGSAMFGEPLELQTSVSVLAFSPDGQFALASGGAESDGVNLILGLRDGAMASAPIENAIGAIDFIAVSADGSTAVLVSSRARRVQFLAGLLDRPLAETPISLDDGSGEISAVAIAGHGQQVALASVQDGAGSILLMDHLAGATSHKIGTVSRAVALVFSNDDNDLIYLDAPSREVVCLRNISGSADREVLLSSDQGLQAPAALAVSGSTVWIADVRTENSISTGYLVEFDLTRKEILGARMLPTVPSRLESLGRPGVLALNDLEAGPLYLLSLRDSSVNFVPSIVR